MTFRLFRVYLTALLIGFLLFSCKKIDPPKPETIVSIDPSEVFLKNDQAYLVKTLKVTVSNLPQGESDEVRWSVENPEIAGLLGDGLVFPKGAGETYVIATLLNGKGFGKCKIIVTDGNDYKFRILLKDKGTTSASVAQPERFLSAKAIERRRKRNIAIDASDLPISETYLQEIQKIGGTIIAKSKWLNTVTINVSDKFSIVKYKKLPFVKDVILVGESKRMIGPTQKYVDVPQVVSNHNSDTDLDYGKAFDNINVNNGQILHKKGFKGAGMDIAVIDAGFINLKVNPAFRNVNIKGAKSFVYENDNPYSIEYHGIGVTACMAGNMPGKYVGTAPEANYWLLRTEDRASEQPVEEDYWVSAAEYADSVGADIINSSLSYMAYGYKYRDNKFEDMDGKTAFATRGANAAASKGIFIVNCAGNDNTWVGAPADSPNVLTVGSVTKYLSISMFSSWGVTVDGRMKPDVMAMGGGANIIDVDGTTKISNGTSYASPIICGLAACLWQAYPKLTNKELLEVIRKSGDRFEKPEIPFGFGIANMVKAMELSYALTKFR